MIGPKCEGTIREEHCLLVAAETICGPDGGAVVRGLARTAGPRLRNGPSPAHGALENAEWGADVDDPNGKGESRCGQPAKWPHGP